MVEEFGLHSTTAAFAALLVPLFLVAVSEELRDIRRTKFEI